MIISVGHQGCKTNLNVGRHGDETVAKIGVAIAIPHIELFDVQIESQSSERIVPLDLIADAKQQLSALVQLGRHGP